MEIDSKCIHGADGVDEKTGAVSVPIYQSATFAHPAVGESSGYDYSRLQNPTREQLEKVLCTLENGTDALAFSTGITAISALMELFSPGDHLIVSDDTYGGTHRLFHHISMKNGIQFNLVDTSDIRNIESHIRPETRAVFIESPTNPMMKVSDIREISDLSKKRGILTIVDNTFLTPYFQQPLELGADLVMHSGTKYLSGHNDTLAGFLVTSNHELAEKLRFIYKTTGACLSPFDSWLVIRGIKTLAIRLQKQEQNAIEIANWMCNQPTIKKVYYAGLKDHPSYAVSKKQARGFGAMISFEVDSSETAVNLLKKIQMILFAESLGGVETLITYPMMQTHADIPVQEREAKGITERLLRLSVGIESVQDIISDLQQALER